MKKIQKNKRKNKKNNLFHFLSPNRNGDAAITVAQGL